MTQAKITCERLLRTPHTIHLDAHLAMIGQPSRASRPDLVGINLPSMNCAIAVEAKGRTGGRTDKVIRNAKKQASFLPEILSTSGAIRVASVASFDPRGRWEAYVEDPVGPIQPLAEPITADQLHNVGASPRDTVRRWTRMTLVRRSDCATTLAWMAFM